MPQWRKKRKYMKKFFKYPRKGEPGYDLDRSFPHGLVPVGYRTVYFRFSPEYIERQGGIAGLGYLCGERYVQRNIPTSVESITWSETPFVD